jgi:hypothetical protein
MKYAVVMTASYDLLPGVNAVLNGLAYYGNKADAYILTWGEEWTSYIDGAKKAFPFATFIDLPDYVKQRDGKVNDSVQFYTCVYRYVFGSDLADYDAVYIPDADFMILNDLTPYFEMTALGDRILCANHVCGDNHDCCTEEVYDICNAPLQSATTFFNPKKFAWLIKQIEFYCKEHRVAEMVGLNYAIIHGGHMKDKVFLLPDVLWLQIKLGDMPLLRKDACGKRWLCLANGERLNALHGRWWYGFNMEKFSLEKDSPDWSSHKNWTFRHVWEMYHFLNTQCRHNIPWREEWGHPDMWSKIGSGHRWD